jgi:hypothetical protein
VSLPEILGKDVEAPNGEVGRVASTCKCGNRVSVVFADGSTVRFLANELHVLSPKCSCQEVIEYAE